VGEAPGATLAHSRCVPHAAVRVHADRSRSLLDESIDADIEAISLEIEALQEKSPTAHKAQPRRRVALPAELIGVSLGSGNMTDLWALELAAVFRAQAQVDCWITGERSPCEGQDVTIP
jgi:hypothetical protein